LGVEALTGYRRVVVQKVDLDTALTAWLLGVTEGDTIVVVRDRADPRDLADPGVLCIECGGSGQVGQNNFDHHDTDEPLPPACVQAYAVAPADRRGEAAARLVEYVAAVDVGNPDASRAGRGVGLSDIFSGMLLTTRDAREQLLRGLRIIEEVVQGRLDPYGPLPDLPGWREYLEAKRRNVEEIEKALEHCLLFTTDGGRRAGFVQSDTVGVLGALYGLGCDIAIAFSPNFRTGSGAVIPKYTVGGNGVRVDVLLPHLNAVDPGWGGPSHGTVIGSPRLGSRLPPERVIEIVRTHL
jgi:hypothetical protein